jgi:hypothetical protein
MRSPFWHMLMSRESGRGVTLRAPVGHRPCGVIEGRRHTGGGQHTPLRQGVTILGISMALGARKVTPLPDSWRFPLPPG